MPEDSVKVNKWDGNAVKNALDDCVKKIIEDTYGYTESHSLLDTRLAISIFSVAFAGLALVWDYLHPFPLSRHVLVLCVASYFMLMIVLQLFAWYVERGIFFTALDHSDNRKWNFSSQMKKYQTDYTLEVEVSSTAAGADGDLVRTGAFERCATKWISDNGTVLEEALRADVLKLHDSLADEKKSN